MSIRSKDWFYLVLSHNNVFGRKPCLFSLFVLVDLWVKVIICSHHAHLIMFMLNLYERFPTWYYTNIINFFYACFIKDVHVLNCYGLDWQIWKYKESNLNFFVLNFLKQNNWNDIQFILILETFLYSFELIIVQQCKIWNHLS